MPSIDTIISSMDSVIPTNGSTWEYLPLFFLKWCNDFNKSPRRVEDCFKPQTMLEKCIVWLFTEFNKVVQESKNQAKEAVAKIPEIRQQILDSEQKARKAEAEFAGAEVNAQMAKENAQDAEKKYAQKASEVFELCCKFSKQRLRNYSWILHSKQFSHYLFLTILFIWYNATSFLGLGSLQDSKKCRSYISCSEKFDRKSRRCKITSFWCIRCNKRICWQGWRWSQNDIWGLTVFLD